MNKRALVCVFTALCTNDWMTTENLVQRSEYRSGVAWPDTKAMSLVATLAAMACGMFVGRRRST